MSVSTGPRTAEMRRSDADSTIAWPDVPGATGGSFGLRLLRGREAMPPVAGRGPAASVRRDALFRRLLAVADVVAILGTLLAVMTISGRALQLGWFAYGGAILLLVVLKLLGLYDRDESLLHKTTLDELPRLFQVATLCTLVAWLGGDLVVRQGLDRREALFIWLGGLVALIVARATARRIALRMTSPERCLFIGDPMTGRAVRSKLDDHGGGVKAELIDQLDYEQARRWSSENFAPARMAQIRHLVQEHDIQRVIIAPQAADGSDTLDFVRTFKAVGVRVSVVPRLLEVVGSAVAFDDLHGLTMMGVRSFDLTRSSAAVKRAFDLFGAIVGLVLLSPLMALVAIAIKLDSRGPVFFRQARMGRRSAPFRVFKFRTMVENAEELKSSLLQHNETSGIFKIADDPRITRVGSLLRKSSLDELPQLINVLRGEMSLVGPRPLVLEEDRRVEGWQRRRLALTPGMTGQWQILGPARVPLDEMVAIDYIYVANWTLWSDIKILLRTLPHVLARRGL